MPSFSTSVMVDAAPQVVFQYATNFPEAPRYIPAIQEIEMLTSGPIGVGTRFKETRMMFGKAASEVMEVAAWEPPQRCVLQAESHGTAFRSTLQITPRGKATELTLQFEAEPRTVFAKLMGVLMRPLMKLTLKTCAKDLEAIKAAAEGKSLGN